MVRRFGLGVSLEDIELGDLDGGLEEAGRSGLGGRGRSLEQGRPQPGQRSPDDRGESLSQSWRVR